MRPSTPSGGLVLPGGLPGTINGIAFVIQLDVSSKVSHAYLSA